MLQAWPTNFRHKVFHFAIAVIALNFSSVILNRILKFKMFIKIALYIYMLYTKILFLNRQLKYQNSYLRRKHDRFFERFDNLHTI